ncbi:MAG: histidinol-phosphatase [Erysipelotrichaceae bacterium]|nr:histidinol-phosphatase [Erysipelotrichaceae bacterium]MBR5049081.1 histidinol-phosphatase [Erysipelotrichaceae bacterium]
MRQDFNYHTHTFRCGHAAICEDEQYVTAALQAGFTTLGFSDHAPYPDRDKPTDRMDYSRLPDYLDSVNSLKEKYAGRIDLKLGFEMEYFPEYQDYIENVLLKKSEYLILGQHYDRPDGEFDYARQDSSPEQLRVYGSLVEEGLRRIPFLYLAHPDYFCAGIHEFDDTCVSISHQICRAAAETGTPMEVNIKLARRPKRMYADGEHYLYPFRRFWQIAQQYPVKCVYGFDAHDPGILLRGEEMYEIADGILEGLKLDFLREKLI